jgi:hypothetical protein
MGIGDFKLPGNVGLLGLVLQAGGRILPLDNGISIQKIQCLASQTAHEPLH